MRLTPAFCRLIGIARGVLDPDTGQAKLDGGFDVRRDVFSRVSVTVLEVVAASAADDVAIASKPASAGINAERPSQAFDMTRPPSRVCSAMNFSYEFGDRHIAPFLNDRLGP